MALWETASLNNGCNESIVSDHHNIISYAKRSAANQSALYRTVATMCIACFDVK